MLQPKAFSRLALDGIAQDGGSCLLFRDYQTKPRTRSTTETVVQGKQAAT